MSSTTVLALNSGETGVERMKLNASKALTVDGSGVTQPVSGAFYPATQPISAAVQLHSQFLEHFIRLHSPSQWLAPYLWTDLL